MKKCPQHRHRCPIPKSQLSQKKNRASLADCLADKMDLFIAMLWVNTPPIAAMRKRKR
jgi:hypothetical protein